MADLRADPQRCYVCKALLPDDKHRQETIRTEGGNEIPVVVCPFAPSGTLTIGYFTETQGSPSEEGLPTSSS